jgi:glutamate carboxypeptidase
MLKYCLHTMLLCFFACGSLHATTLTPLETSVVRSVDKHQAEALALLEKIVNINSGTQNIDGVKQVGAVVQAAFEKLGFKATWVTPPPDMNRAGTLILTHDGNKGKRLLLIGHLDTVFSKESPHQRIHMKGNIATGPGVIDDKGGIVVMWSALKALYDVGELQHRDITIVLTGDEENSGKPLSISRAPLIDAAQDREVALDFEPAFQLNSVTTARRGTSNWTLHTAGHSAHSSVIFQPHVGDGAIFEMARILNTLREKFVDEQYASFNPGLMVGGTTASLSPDTTTATGSGKKNIVAQTAVAQGDIRYISISQKEAMKALITHTVSEHLPGTSGEVVFVDSAPPMPPTPANEALLKQYSDISQHLGFGSVEAVDPATRGAGDLSHVVHIVPACMGGLGPIGRGMHTDAETLDVPTLAVNAKRVALLMNGL